MINVFFKFFLEVKKFYKKTDFQKYKETLQSIDEIESSITKKSKEFLQKPVSVHLNKRDTYKYYSKLFENISYEQEPQQLFLTFFSSKKNLNSFQAEVQSQGVDLRPSRENSILFQKQIKIIDQHLQPREKMNLMEIANKKNF